MANDPSQDYGNSSYNTGVSTGTNAINSYDPTASANSVRGGYNSLFGSQMGTIGNTVGSTDSLQGAVNKQTPLNDIYDKASNAFDLPGLNANAAYLNNQVTFQPEYQQSLMRGFDASQPQIDGATNYNLMRLAPMASMATSQAQNAQQQTQNYVDAYQKQEQYNLLPSQTQAQYTNDAMARQSTGYDYAAQSELQGYIEKMKSGVTLSGQEMERANTLAQMETSYQNAITGANAGIKEAQIGNQNVTLTPGSTYLNANTGQAYNPYIKPA